MKILVTGGTGFIGSNLIEKLKMRGDEVCCISKDETNLQMLRAMDVEVVHGDLNNVISWKELLKNVDYIYHLAGVTRAKYTQDYFIGNYEATKRLTEACALYCNNLKRFVYISSLSAAGPSKNYKPLLESDKCHPISHYGKSKMMGEMEILSKSDKFPITILRPSAVYGPRDRDMFQLFQIIQRGIQPLIGFRKKFLNLIHCDDLVNGIILAGENPRAESETYFLGSEVDYSIEYIGAVIADILNRRILRLRIPHPIVYTIGGICGGFGKMTGRSIFFNLQKARESVQLAWSCSIRKAQIHLGFNPKISLVSGMYSTWNWYKENGWLK